MDSSKMKTRRRSGTSKRGGSGSESGKASGVPMGNGRGGGVRIPSEEEVRKGGRSRTTSVAGADRLGPKEESKEGLGIETGSEVVRASSRECLKLKVDAPRKTLPCKRGAC